MTPRVTVGSTVIAWCPHAEMYSEEATDISAKCSMCDDEFLHIARKRRGYICSTCSLRNVFFSRADFLAHQCE